ncbi:MurR/RpiR family transcriptional regulator, partial [Thioclava sp. BHET1]
MKTVAPRTLTDMIQQHADRLTEVDTRLLSVLVEDPVRAAMETGKDVSARAGAHPAAAVRLARRLGFAGYPEFRSFLQESLIEGGGDFESGSARLAARLVRAGDAGLLASLIEGEIAALTRLGDAVSDADIRCFSEVLREAGRIFLFGRSHGAALSTLATLRLRRSGYNAVDLGASMHQLAEQLAPLGPGDALWLFELRRPASVTETICTLARARGATVLAVTDISGARLCPPPDHMIATSRGAPGQPQSLVVPMTVLNAVILDLAAIDDGRSLAALEAFRNLRDSAPAFTGR